MDLGLQARDDRPCDSNPSGDFRLGNAKTMSLRLDLAARASKVPVEAAPNLREHR
jgi:hypothetical protein